MRVRARVRVRVPLLSCTHDPGWPCAVTNRSGCACHAAPSLSLVARAAGVARCEPKIQK